MNEQQICIFNELFLDEENEVPEVITICKQNNLVWRQVTNKEEIKLFDTIVFSASVIQMLNIPLHTQTKIDLRFFRTFDKPNLSKKIITGFNFLPHLSLYEVLFTGFSTHRELKQNLMKIAEGFGAHISPAHQDLDQFKSYLDLCRKQAKKLIIVVLQPFLIIKLFANLEEEHVQYFSSKLFSYLLFEDLQRQTTVSQLVVDQVIDKFKLIPISSTLVVSEGKPKLDNVQLKIEIRGIPFEKSRIYLVNQKKDNKNPLDQQLLFTQDRLSQEGVQLIIPRYFRKGGHNLVTHCVSTFGCCVEEGGISTESLFYSYAANLYVVVYKQESVNFADVLTALFNEQHDLTEQKHIVKFCQQIQLIPFSKFEAIPGPLFERTVLIYDYKTNFKSATLPQILIQYQAEKLVSIRPMLWLFMCYICYRQQKSIVVNQNYSFFSPDTQFEMQFFPFPEQDSFILERLCRDYHYINALTQPTLLSQVTATCAVYEEELLQQLTNIETGQKQVLLKQVVQMLNQDQLCKRENFKFEALQLIIKEHVFGKITLGQAIQNVKGYETAGQKGEVDYSINGNFQLSNVQGFSDNSQLFRGDEQPQGSICIADQYFSDQ